MSIEALIEDLRLNHEFCPKEVILQAADELERLLKVEQANVVTSDTSQERVAEKEKQRHEPVAWLCEPDEHGMYGLPLSDGTCTKCFPVYTQPQEATRKWVGLTEMERNHLEDYCEMMIGKPAFDAIEAKLKEKNT